MKNTLVHLATLLASIQVIFMIALRNNTAAGADANVEFRTVDVFIDSKGAPLAAFQLEWRVASGQAKIVGIEGGEHPAFKEPPFYDPKAMQHERAILAGFRVAESAKLPKGRVRIATIHLQVTDGKPCQYSIQRAAAVDHNGEHILIEASTEERNTQ